jgi:hypothetical protein
MHIESVIENTTDRGRGPNIVNRTIFFSTILSDVSENGTSGRKDDERKI